MPKLHPGGAPMVRRALRSTVRWIELIFASPERRLSRRSKKPLTLRFHPRFDELEAREVPAVITWLGGSIGDPNSWDLGRLPDSADDVTFNGSVSNASMTVPGGLGLSFHSIQLI